jgi:hypothetical protein
LTILLVRIWPLASGFIPSTPISFLARKRNATTGSQRYVEDECATLHRSGSENSACGNKKRVGEESDHNEQESCRVTARSEMTTS